MQVLFPEEASLSLILSLFPMLYMILRKADEKGIGETETAMKKSAVNSVSDTADYSKKTFFMKKIRFGFCALSKGETTIQAPTSQTPNYLGQPRVHILFFPGNIICK